MPHKCKPGLNVLSMDGLLRQKEFHSFNLNHSSGCEKLAQYMGKLRAGRVLMMAVMCDSHAGITVTLQRLMKEGLGCKQFEDLKAGTPWCAICVLGCRRALAEEYGPRGSTVQCEVSYDPSYNYAGGSRRKPGRPRSPPTDPWC